jgi:hypothetical protein
MRGSGSGTAKKLTETSFAWLGSGELATEARRSEPLERWIASAGDCGGGGGAGGAVDDNDDDDADDGDADDGDADDGDADDAVP